MSKILLWLLILLVLAVASSFLFRLEKLNIREVVVSGNKVTEGEALKNVVADITDGYYFFLFPKTSVFLYPKGQIKKELGNQFKRLNDIKMSVGEEGVLKITLSEREALYTWCGESVLITEVSKCYFLDSSGYVFDEAPYFSGEVYFKFFGSLRGAAGPLGSYFSVNDFPSLVFLKNTLEAMELDPVSLEVSGEDISILLSRRNSAVGPEIILKADADFEKVIENLDSALSTEPLLTDFKNKYSSLEYLDLRFGNKVYFKFR